MPKKYKTSLVDDFFKNLDKNSEYIEINVLSIPGITENGFLTKHFSYNHGYYLKSRSFVSNSYSNSGFSFVSYNEDTKILKLKNNSWVNNIITDDFLQQIDIGFLRGKTFYIPDYQRGYRWLKEAKYFVKDIKNNSRSEYLFQPIVVRKINIQREYKQKLIFGCKNGLVLRREGTFDGDDFYELIDGQQRLTTLLLVLMALNYDPGYSLIYESIRELDNTYIRLANVYIVDELDGMNKLDFLNKLKDTARFIWYCDSTGRTCQDIFKSLNADKTDLTSAELFKARLMNINNNENDNTIAFQFDEVESKLNDEELWRFLCDNSFFPNRIQLILDVYSYQINRILSRARNTERNTKYIDIARQLIKSKLDDKFAFLSFDNFCEAILYANSSQIAEYKENCCLSFYWEKIYDIFEILSSWHMNYETHNLIGYLLARKNLKYINRIKLIAELIEEQQKNNNADFINYLYNKIKNEDLLDSNGDKINIELFSVNSLNDSISFETKKDSCYNILLLTNIYRSLISKTFFDFRCLKDKYSIDLKHKLLWDIEHITPKNTKKDLLAIIPNGETIIRYDENKKTGDGLLYVFETETIILELKRFVDNLVDQNEITQIKNLLMLLENVNDNRCPDLQLNQIVNNIWNVHAKGAEENNSISNLAILEADINRQYHDTFFNEKRLTIQFKDDNGWFIPTMTKQLFLNKKYAKESIWDKAAEDNYRREINIIINHFIKKADNNE